jgi:hypothetical protein
MADDIKQLYEFLLAHFSIFLSLGALLSGAVSLGWTVAFFLNKREIRDYKRQIEGINAQHQLDMADLAKQAEAGSVLDEKFPNIGKLEPIDVPLGLPRAEHHKAFNILLTQSTAHWSFQTSSLGEVFSDWFGSSLKNNEHLSEGYGLIGGGEERSECLLWKGTTEVSVENSGVLKKMYPFIIVRTIRHEAGDDPTTEELFNFIHWLQMWDKAMPNARFEIIKMHRTPKKAYLRGYYRFAGLEIAENPMKPAKKYNEYFLMRQIFVYRSDTHTTIISTGLPNRELVTDPYYGWLKAWWDALKLVKGFGA